MTTGSALSHQSFSTGVLLHFGGLGGADSSSGGPTCYSVFSNLPLLPHHVTTFSPRPMHVCWDHWKGWGWGPACSLPPLPLVLPSFVGGGGSPAQLTPSHHRLLRSHFRCPWWVKGGHRRLSLWYQSARPKAVKQRRLLFSRQHPPTALPERLVPISCWRLFNHLTRVFNFHCLCTYISIPANGLPRELSSPKS